MTQEIQSEDQLITRAQEALSQCNWVIGECAAEWTERYSRGRTDADFGALIGLSGDQVYQRRRVWECFADVSGDYPNLKWSHFYVAVNWDDAAECLQWANEIEATVAEMKAWRRAQHGEDLKEPSEELPPFSVAPEYLSIDQNSLQRVEEVDEDREPAMAGAGASSGRAETVSSAPREAGQSEYAPFGKGARGEVAGEDQQERSDPEAADLYKRAAGAIERVVTVLSPELLDQFSEIPLDVQQRFLKAVNTLQSRTGGLS
ncbi:hypothetical protein AB1L42_18505 [Thalassoglobus sp. JC818]|uniref:hypothetical protein n=1 Tax=Thalassoglobus sp. JC818 TaxID=3232136 RepID=UPI003459A40E